VRAFDGKDYSDTATVNFAVDNQKAQAKGFIPGATGVLALMGVLAAGMVAALRRKR